MKLFGGIYFDERGLSTSIRGMHMQTELMSTINSNIMGFDKIGYQREEAVVSSFSEYVGVHGLSKVKSDEIGRLYSSEKPLDFALAKKGYFQYETPNGIQMTRDGRFMLDKNGNLLTQEGFKVLARDGSTIKFKNAAIDIEKIKVNTKGEIFAYNDTNGQLEKVSQFSVATKDGNISDDVDVRQGFVESGNVQMASEVFKLVPVRRNFEANRQMFIIQNDELSKTIQELGRSS